MSCIYCKYLLRGINSWCDRILCFFPSCCTNSTLMILVIKPFDSERNDPVLFVSSGREGLGSL